MLNKHAWERERMSALYDRAYTYSVEQPDAFWLEAAQRIDWIETPKTGWTKDKGWFADGQLNVCWNAVDRHVAAGRGEDAALIFTSAITGRNRTYSFAELQDNVARTAGMLQDLGVTRGDRVVLYMPMIPEAVFAMLACARIGAVHVVVFGGFAAPELAKRIDDTQPKALLTASCGLEGAKVLPYMPMVEHALDLCSHKTPSVVVFQREQVEADLATRGHLDWAALAAKAPRAECTPMGALDPLYVLHTSGTTGAPKGVVRETGSYAVALAWSMENVYGVKQSEVFWAASDIGWVVGHSYIVYGPLLAGVTTVMFEGKPVGTPDAGTFWRVIRDNKVRAFFTAPTAIRAIRKDDPDGQFLKDIGTGDLRTIFLAGERADPDTVHWLEDHSKLPVIDHWWQTELGWPAIATCVGLDDTRRKAGSAGFPVPGFRVAIVNDAGEDVATGAAGHVIIKTPLPPGCYTSLWNNPVRFSKAFENFPGAYETGDSGHRDEDGLISIMSRTDDLINVAGHRLSTGQMEQILMAHPSVVECAVIGVPDPIKGMAPLAFAVARGNVDQTQRTALPGALIDLVRTELGPVAALKTVYLVDAMPKTRSGKILRNTLRQLLSDEHVEVPPTIDDPDTLRRIRDVLRAQPSG
jgi:propionyl-CoA synthetase